MGVKGGQTKDYLSQTVDSAKVMTDPAYSLLSLSTQISWESISFSVLQNILHFFECCLILFEKYITFTQLGEINIYYKIIIKTPSAPKCTYNLFGYALVRGAGVKWQNDTQQATDD